MQDPSRTLYEDTSAPILFDVYSVIKHSNFDLIFVWKINRYETIHMEHFDFIK